MGAVYLWPGEGSFTQCTILGIASHIISLKLGTRLWRDGSASADGGFSPGISSLVCCGLWAETEWGRKQVVRKEVIGHIN